MACSNPPPVKVPDYIVGDKIGSGGYADVYKAINVTGGKECFAIKAVLRSTLSAGSTESLMTEIRLLKKLKHDHIVQLKDFLCDANYIYIVMEYCSGGDLSHFIKSRHRLPEAACQRFLQQLADALKYMRDENVSHFDLKPQNILLASRRNPIIKIGDFGLAQHMPEAESMSKVKGSPLYMAPEILLEKSYDAKVDLWSVGVILYECLFGKAPYSSSTMEELIHRIRTDKEIAIPHNTAISSNCKDLLVRCLQRDPNKRIGFDEFFNHPFVDLEHKPSPANMDKARDLLFKAVECDGKQEFEEALSLYTDGLLYLVPALHVEKDASKRMTLRRSVTGYLARTEKLKRLLSQNDSAAASIDMPSMSSEFSSYTTSTQSAEHRKEIEDLLALATSTMNMTGAIDIAVSAEQYEMQGSYAIALEKYELALGKLLSLLENEPQGRRKVLLLSVIKRWMAQAEQLKRILNSKKLKENEIENAIDDEKVETSNDSVKTIETQKTESKKKIQKLERKLSTLSVLREASASILSPMSGYSSASLPTNTIPGTSNSSPSKVLSEADYEKNCSIQ